MTDHAQDAIDLIDRALNEPEIDHDRIDRLLDHPTQHDSSGHTGYPTSYRGDDVCWREHCDEGATEDSGLCRPCRLYLAEVTDEDPSPKPEFVGTFAGDALAASPVYEVTWNAGDTNIEWAYARVEPPVEGAHYVGGLFDDMARRAQDAFERMVAFDEAMNELSAIAGITPDGPEYRDLVEALFPFGTDAAQSLRQLVNAHQAGVNLEDFQRETFENWLGDLEPCTQAADDPPRPARNRAERRNQRTHPPLCRCGPCNPR